MSRSRLLSLPLSLLVLASAAACGQRPGVGDGPVPPMPVTMALPDGAYVDPETGQIVDADGNVIGSAGDFGSGSPEAGGSGSSGLDGSGGSGAGPEGDGSGGDYGGAIASEPGAGNASGVTDDTIRIGAHAPLTGAAPIPSDSAEKGNSLYWEWLQENGRKIHGRTVEAILRNDNYNPSQAVAVCKEMVQKDQVFLLYGFAGTDQIQACGRYAASVGVPYLSVGVTESGLTDLPNYFAVSLSYAQQGPLLADLLTSELGARSERNGMLRFDTPNFQDAHDSFVQAMGRSGARVSYDRAVSRAATQTEAQTVVQEMKAARVQNVYVLTSPVWFIQVLQAAKTQGYEPQWVGVGISKALDTVASVGCRNGTVNKAKFFSPFPAWADINRYDPSFEKAVRAVYPDKGRGDDFMVIGWGIAKVLAALLEAPGRNLTRERFVYFGERTKNIKTNVYPTVSFSPGDRLGGTQVHLNEAQCSGYKNGDNRWHTIQAFVSDF